MILAQFTPETFWIAAGALIAGAALFGTFHTGIVASVRREERRLTALETLERFRREECDHCAGNLVRLDEEAE